MERRHFLKYGTAVGSAAFILKKDRSTETGPEQQRPNEQIEKVKRAMLSMQRQAWEQGVAGRPDQAVKQIEGMRRLLWNPEKRLFSHIWDDGQHDFERKDFWGVGNGWAAAGMSRVIRALPTEMTKEKARLVGYVKDVIDGCLACQRPDGLFHDVLDNPKTFVETNLAQMLAYSIYRGLQGSWLGKIHMKQADRMREAALAKVDSLGLVQGVCGSPEFSSPGVATEGQAFCLLMEAARGDLDRLTMGREGV